jgi:predicted nuclease of predicted toxin-antitoxin system
MRLLLDEAVPRRLGRSLANHQVRTVVEMGWSGVKNGNLLTFAAPHFDALITVDKNLPHQQNLSTLPVSVVLLDAPSVALAELLVLLPALEKALALLPPRSFVRVGVDH